jgi:flagellar biosynthetic protein FliQ
MPQAEYPMTESYILSFAKDALMVSLILSAPVLAVSLVIGIVISLFQAATQINEVTLSFVPKVIGAGLVLLLLGSWMAQQLLSFTANVFMNLPSMPR